MRHPLRMRALGTLGGGSVGASPQRPGDDVRGVNAPPHEAGGSGETEILPGASDPLDRPPDEGGRPRDSRGGPFGGGTWFAWWRPPAGMGSADMTGYSLAHIAADSLAK